MRRLVYLVLEQLNKELIRVQRDSAAVPGLPQAKSAVLNLHPRHDPIKKFSCTPQGRLVVRQSATTTYVSLAEERNESRAEARGLGEAS